MPNVNKQEINKIRLSSLRKNISIVSQDLPHLKEFFEAL